ncbi:S26 family signal peptidase [Streptomyces hypolithicus]
MCSLTTMSSMPTGSSPRPTRMLISVGSWARRCWSWGWPTGFVSPSGSPGGGGFRFDVTVPGGRMFVLGDNRGNSVDSRSFLSEQSGTVAVGAVRSRVLDDWMVPVLLIGAAATGVVLGLTGAGPAVAFLVVRRRSARPASVPVPVQT